MSSRGTDPATERCQLRECSEKSGLDGLLADAFSAGAEVTLLGLPGLVWLMDVEPNAAVKFAALVGWVALVGAAHRQKAFDWPRHRWISMDWVLEFMRVYRYVFHPLAFLFATWLLLVYYEWNGESDDLRNLAVRVGAVVAIGLAALIPTGVYLLVTDQAARAAVAGNDWPVDLATASGLVIAGGLAWVVWSATGWGSATKGAAVAIVVTAVPYAPLSVVWNVSGHVAFSTVPALYLASLDRKFAPLLVVPLLMVPNRPLLGMHTWPQAIGGLLLGVAGVLLARRLGWNVRRAAETVEQAMVFR